jgi:hypothetical protein
LDRSRSRRGSEGVVGIPLAEHGDLLVYLMVGIENVAPQVVEEEFDFGLVAAAV